MVEERELVRSTVRTCVMQKRVSFAFFKQWYWDCFDEDVQVSISGTCLQLCNLQSDLSAWTPRWPCSSAEVNVIIIDVTRFYTRLAG